MIDPSFTPAEKRKLEIAAGIAFSFFPYLGGIFAKLDIRFDDRIKTAAVTSSGKLLLNHRFFAGLTPGLETAFILAHEMLHLAQMVFERRKAFPDQESLNIAHDILINELLCDTMKLDQPPCHGLSWQWFLERYPVPEYDAWWLDADDEPLRHPIPGLPEPAKKASAYSLEEMVRIIVSVKGSSSHPKRNSWDGPGGGSSNSGGIFTNNPFADIFDSGAKKPADPPKSAVTITLDMVPEEMEGELFPDEDNSGRAKKRDELRIICRAAAVKNLVLSSFGKGDDEETERILIRSVEIVRSCYTPTWEMVMQRWLDGCAEPRRSWARASRRGAWRSDVMLRGRAQERFMLHIILDTSGSMAEIIPYLLGQISSFARNTGMVQVHIIQCSTGIMKEDYVDIERLDKFQIFGYDGSDLSAAMLKLAEDPDVTSALIITDGCIGYPPEEQIPYDVLWCHPDIGSCPGIPYGKVIHVPIPEGE